MKHQFFVLGEAVSFSWPKKKKKEMYLVWSAGNESYPIFEPNLRGTFHHLMHPTSWKIKAASLSDGMPCYVAHILMAFFLLFFSINFVPCTTFLGTVLHCYREKNWIISNTRVAGKNYTEAFFFCFNFSWLECKDLKLPLYTEDLFLSNIVHKSI